MQKQEAKCPKCGKGFMKMKLAAVPLGLSDPKKPMQAKCNNIECGHEEEFTKVYPHPSILK